jgi:hypothetical protein
MGTQSFTVSVGDQVFVGRSVEEVGAVMRVARDHLTIYVENGGEFRLDGPEIISAHDGKLVLDPSRLEPALVLALEQAHARETE